MIQRVYEQVQKATRISNVVVATDNGEIYKCVSSFKGNVCLTSEHHPSGTDRCHEALTKQQDPYDYVINVQGDEPFIDPKQIDLLASVLDGSTEIATLIKPITDSELLFNPNIVKAVVGANQKALYFSRAPIPYLRGVDQSEWINKNTYYKHIGMYAYRTDVLKKISNLPPSNLEKAESLEQLRWLENGYTIGVAVTNIETIGIDTPDDLEKAEAYLKTL